MGVISEERSEELAFKLRLVKIGAQMGELLGKSTRAAPQSANWLVQCPGAAGSLG